MRDEVLNTFIKNIRKTLDDAGQNLDGATASRLTQARYIALADRSARSRMRRPHWAVASTAAIFALALLLVVALPDKELFYMPVGTGFDWQIITADEPLEFYQEDIDFYEWVSEELENDTQRSGGVSYHSPGDTPLLSGNQERGGCITGSCIYRVSWNI